MNSKTSIPNPLPRKERERLARRQAILRAARQVFAEKGYTLATLDEIAERAEFGKGTLYNYFDSKEGLFTAAMASLLEDIRDIADQIGGDELGLRESLVEWAGRVIGYYHDNQAFCRMLMRDKFSAQPDSATCHMEAAHERMTMISEPLVPLIEAAIRRKQIRDGDPEIVTTMFVGLVHHYIMHVTTQTFDGAPKDVAGQAELIVSIFYDGVALRDDKGAV